MKIKYKVKGFSFLLTAEIKNESSINLINLIKLLYF